MQVEVIRETVPVKNRHISVEVPEYLESENLEVIVFIPQKTMHRQVDELLTDGIKSGVSKESHDQIFEKLMTQHAGN
ncbi:hypothetical protein [Desulfurispira natronophila]|uniref:Uncharacterized protein n=1 Tax=Desulfurispira natronophila TaxID=682562 RepID=A0A7W8DI09_9BACT|nr:hypothetical protein [Desulfurispira natronophila]MBB5022863.1 hypothetical protein [Desulfurispira natronophila]